MTGVVSVRWPESRNDYLRLAEVVLEMVGGRADVAARYYEFVSDEIDEATGAPKLVKGWGPWKGRRLAQGAAAGDGELVREYRTWKTGQFERRALKPLNAANFLLHLRGRERLGVYPLDAEMQVRFIAADFDDHSGTLDPDEVWAEVKRFWDACDAHDWQAHIERSKSGTGYHVWLFFDRDIPAVDARALGRWLFEESENLKEDEDFSTFDRFFPSQSVLPKHAVGFGNLIGLPLAGQIHYMEGRNAWVDPETRETIADAWGYTLDIYAKGRNAHERVAEFLAEWEISREEPQQYDGEPPDPDAPLAPDEQFDAMFERCAFCRFVPDKANWPKAWPAATEPLWFAWLSNISRYRKGWTVAHEDLRWNPKYSEGETNRKLAHSLRSSHPMTCGYIQKELGFKGCPADGCALPSGKPTRAPAGLGAWAMEARPKQAAAGKKKAGAVRIDPPQQDEDHVGMPRARDEDDLPESLQIVPPEHLPEGWHCDNDGVHQDRQGMICLRPLWVHALTRNMAGTWGIALRFYDLDWQEQRLAIPAERIHEQGGVLGRELASVGLPIVPGKEKWVSRYLALCEVLIDKRIRAAMRLGWYDAPESPALFVMPDQVLGSSPEEIIYQPDVPMQLADTITSRGRLSDWQKGVADRCVGNPMLMFALMCGLAGPMLKLCHEQSGGFHLYGVTSGGKTSAAQVAASVWGCGADPQEGPEVTSIRKWYTTGNALESIAEVHNDMLLTLDEIGEVDPHELGRIIYQLAGGLSKGRANAGGGLRAMRTWRMLFFSTGEKSVRQMLGGVGQTLKGGQGVRLPDIPADDERTGQRAIITDSHGADPKDFVQDLKRACASHYGLAGPTLVSYLIAQAEARGMAVLSGDLREELRQMEVILRRDYSQAADAEGNRPEVALAPEGRRVLRRFAVVALAGAYAAKAGIVSWQLPEILRAVLAVRDRWLSEAGEERSEMDRALAHLRDQLIRHSARFEAVDGTTRQPVQNKLGWRSKEYFLLTASSLAELCGDHDMRTMLRQLHQAGHLWTETETKLQRKAPRGLFGHRRPYLYWIDCAFMGETDERDTAEDVAAGIVAQEGFSMPAAPGRRELPGDRDIPF